MMVKYSIIILHSFLNFIIVSCGNYDVILESINYNDEPNDYINWNIQVSKYNKTINIMNGDITILKDLTALTQIRITGYEKRGNSYQQSLVDVTMNICDFLNESHVKEIFINKSNFPRDCTISAGTYTVKEMTGECDDLPEKLNGRYWKIEFNILAEGNTLILLELYARIKSKIPRNL